jgi:hypothetical protein
MKRLLGFLSLNLPVVALVASGAVLAVTLPMVHSGESIQNRNSSLQASSDSKATLHGNSLYKAPTEPAALTSPAASHTAAPQHSTNSVFTSPTPPLPPPSVLPVPVTPTPVPPPVIIEPNEPEYPYPPINSNPCTACYNNTKNGPQLQCPMESAYLCAL